MVISILFPEKSMVKFLYFFNKRTSKNEEAMLLVNKLYDHISYIVPYCFLKNDNLKEYRLLFELSDARDIILSHHENVFDIKHEADIYAQQNTIIDKIGPYIHNDIKEEEMLEHFINVAKEFDLIQKSTTEIFPINNYQSRGI